MCAIIFSLLRVVYRWPQWLRKACIRRRGAYKVGRTIAARRRRAGCGCDPESAKQQLLAAVASEPRVLTEPLPVIYATGADASGLDLVLYCWASNADFMATQSDLWLQLVRLTGLDSGFKLAISAQEVQLREPG